MAEPRLRYALKLTAPGLQEPIKLDRIEGREAISELFEFELSFRLAPEQTIDFSAIVGKKATATVERSDGQRRWFHGIVSAMSDDGFDAAHSFFQAVLVPEFWWCAQNVQCRVYQNLTVEQIIEDKLKAAGVAVKFDLRDDYFAHNYCVQYLESDFDFLSRLMEEEGIGYWFDQSEKECVLRIGDYDAEKDRPSFAIDEVRGGVRSENRIHEWRTTMRAKTTKLRLRDHSFQQLGWREASARPLAKSQVENLLAAAPPSLEILEYGAIAHRFDEMTPNGGHEPQRMLSAKSLLGGDKGKAPTLTDCLQRESERIMKARQDRQLVEAYAITGGGDIFATAAGKSFSLKGHRRADGEYRATWVEHIVDVSANSNEAPYSNRFGCIPDSVNFRPARITPKPRIHGTQTAEVVGAGCADDHEISCDAYGRVKVQFHWDGRQEKDLLSSCWVRVTQPMAGDGYGTVFIPRIGQEVIVGFENGDPDAPVILGSVYNSKQLPPQPLPASRSQTIFKSRTRHGSAHTFNGFAMDDRTNAEHFQLQAEKFMTTNVKDTAFANFGVGQHEVHGKTYSHRVGGLPIDYQQTTGAPPPGGNVLRGEKPDYNPDDKTNDGPFSWKAKVMGGWADSLAFSIGRKAGGHAGLDTGLTVGYKSNTVIHPVGLVYSFIEGGGASMLPAGERCLAPANFMTGPLGAGLGALTGVATAGNTAVIIGTSTTLIYGPSIKVTRGHNTDKKLSFARFPNPGRPPWTAANKAAFIVSALYSLFRLGDQFLTVLGSSPEEQNKQGMISSLVELGLINLWTDCELGANGVAAIGSGIAFPFVAVASAGSAGARRLGRAAVDWVDRQLANAAIDGEMALGEGPGCGAGLASAEYRKTKDGVVDRYLSDGLHSIEGVGVQIISCPGPTDDKYAGVLIASHGPKKIDGNIDIIATQQTMIVGGGQAAIIAKTDPPAVGQITVDCGPLGSITLQSGIAKQPNSIAMEPESGIKASSLMGVALDVVPHSVKLHPATGVNLSAFGLNSIKMAPDSVTIERGANSIKISDTGISINALSLSISTAGKVSIDALGPASLQCVGLTLQAVSTSVKSPSVSFLPG